MKKNVIWGIMILIFAFLYLINALGVMQDFNIFRIALMGMVGVGFINGIYKKSVGKIIYNLIFLYYLGAGYLGLPELSLFTALVFATLLQIGIVLILGKSFKVFVIKADKNKNLDIDFNLDNNHNHDNSYNDYDDNYNNDNISISTTFGESKRYISSEDFKSCNISSTFGDVKIYFDNVIIKGDSATINVSTTFSDVTIYLPKSWHVDVDASLVFADSTIQPNNNNVCDKTLIIKGSVTFGEIIIKRI